MISKVFPLLATLFIFILAANWIGLFPGVGTIGFGKPGPGFLSLSEVDAPLLRPANADLNMNAGMALLLWSCGSSGQFRKSCNRLPQRTVCPRRRNRFSSVGTNSSLSLRRSHRAYFYRNSAVSLSFSAIWQYLPGETLLHTMQTIGSGLPSGWDSLLRCFFRFHFTSRTVGRLVRHLSSRCSAPLH